MEWITAIIFYILGTWVGSRHPVDLRCTQKEADEMVAVAQIKGYNQGYKKAKEEKQAVSLDLRKE